MKQEALKLANDLEELHEQDLIDGVAHLSMPQASTMIRRLVEELDALNAKESMWQEMIEDLECQVIKYKQGEPFHDFNTLTLDTGEKRSLKPLSDEQIINIWLPFATDGIKGKIEFARAILKKASEK